MKKVMQMKVGLSAHSLAHEAMHWEAECKVWSHAEWRREIGQKGWQIVLGSECVLGSEPLDQGEISSSEDEKDREEEQLNLNRFAEIANNCWRTFGGEDKQEKEKKVEQNDKEKSMVKMHNRFVIRNNEDSDIGNEQNGFSQT